MSRRVTTEGFRHFSLTDNYIRLHFRAVAQRDYALLRIEVDDGHFEDDLRRIASKAQFRRRRGRKSQQLVPNVYSQVGESRHPESLLELRIDLVEQLARLVVGLVALRLDRAGAGPVEADRIQDLDRIWGGAEPLASSRGGLFSALVDGHVVLLAENSGRGEPGRARSRDYNPQLLLLV